MTGGALGLTGGALGPAGVEIGNLRRSDDHMPHRRCPTPLAHAATCRSCLLWRKPEVVERGGTQLGRGARGHTEMKRPSQNRLSLACARAATAYVTKNHQARRNPV